MKKKMLILQVFAIAVFGSSTLANTPNEQKSAGTKQPLPEFMVSGYVTDEDKNPIENAELRFVFQDALDSIGGTYFSTFTDSKGFFSGRGRCAWGTLGIDLDKKGYYGSDVPIPRPTDIKDDRWLPWNPTVKAVLRPIKNPIPMYTKYANTKVPVNGQPCGYDLQKGDWVAPWGKGEVADFVFESQCEYKDWHTNKTSCKLSFSNLEDGIQIANLPEVGKYSSFKWDYEAPDKDYKNEMNFDLSQEYRKPSKSNFKRDTSYYFRVRTRKDEKTFTAGFYGKILAGIRIEPSDDGKYCALYFSYCLNPTPLDRNMEYDSKRNLFPEPKGR